MITEGVERIHRKLRKKQNKQHKKKKQINANRINKKNNVKREREGIKIHSNRHKVIFLKSTAVIDTRDYYVTDRIVRFS